jgi:hypothetical protein
MNEYDEGRDRSQYPYWPQTQEPYPEEKPGSRPALYVSIGAAALSAAGLVTALVVGLDDSGTTRTSGTPPPSPHSVAC